MDNPQHPDPSQELPPPPEEKLLRAPTFWEKYGAIVTWLIIFILLAVASLSGIQIFKGSQQATPHTEVMSPEPSVSSTNQSTLPTVFNGRDETVAPEASPSAVIQACSQEAKICPDGSYVGRSGPNCEFTACL